jgi:enediyne biosynthesis protein E4
MQRILPWVVILLAVVLGCGSPAVISTNPPEEGAAAPWFEDITEKVGLNFHQQAGPTGSFFMPQVMGSGLAVLDADNDGRFDLLLLNNAGPDSGITNKLFLQNADGTFRDASAGSGLDVAGYGMGVAVGDIDNDGWVDVYISQYGGGRLFHNRGKGADGKWLGFEEITATSGVAQPRWGTSCSFMDFDRDGWLDLVVANYVDYDPSHSCTGASGRTDFCHPNQFSGTATRLFRNRGRDSTGKWLGFTDVTAESGLAAKPSNGLGVVCADFNGDGWPDIFVANDMRQNHLWINKKNGTFAEEAVERGLAYDGAGHTAANMGIALADLHGEGRLDVFVTHLSEELPTLWKQDDPGRFHDNTAASGLAASRWRGTGFGTIAIDFDHDGEIDLAAVNGRVSRNRTPVAAPREGLPEFWHSYAERNQLFANSGGGKFRDVSGTCPAFTGSAEVTRGLAWVDLDGDGAIDLITTSIEGRARVFRNVAPKAGHWLIVRAFDSVLKRDAYGALVTVTAGGRKRVTPANPGQSFCSSGDPRAHFGLGSADKIDAIQIDWPDGTLEFFPGGTVDRVVTINKGTGSIR